MFGELDRVADQVHKDLTQSSGVAHDRHRHIRADVAHQLNAFGMRPNGKCFERLAHRASQVEWDSFYQKLAGLNFGEIQNVIDHLEQGVR